MSATDTDQLKQLIVSLVKPCVGHSFSEQNYRKFMLTLQRLGDIQGVQKFLTNFMLRGSGMGTTESVVAEISGLMCEGTHRVMLTDRQIQLRNLVMQYGYRATLLE